MRNWTIILLICVLGSTGGPAFCAEDASIDKARESAKIAGCSLSKVQRWLHEVALKKIEPDTGLYHPDGSFNYQDAWADCYPFLVWAAWATDIEALNGPVRSALHAEIKHCPPKYFTDRKNAFGGSEYVKDGLIAIVEVTGKDEWFDRMKAIETDAAASHAARALLQRLLPDHADRFVFEVIPPLAGRDLFEIETHDGKVVIRGNTGVSMAMGLNWYLKHFCHCHVSWYGDQLDLPDPLPRVETKVRKQCWAKHRYFLNYCCFGYSLPWWDWAQWERLIDWMALNGINAPLAVTGQEAVWQAVGKRLELSDEQITQFLAGPPYLPFGWMGCLDGWGGPLPQSWIDGHESLGKKILARERALGMTPVLQGFTGHVPAAVAAKFPDAKLHKIQWIEWQTHLLYPLDPLFAKVAKLFMDEQSKRFGTDHLYAADTFIEMKPPSGDLKYLNQLSRAIYDGMAVSDPQAIWVLQTWIFHHGRAFWTHDRIQAFLDAVPHHRMLCFDLVNVARQVLSNHGAVLQRKVVEARRSGDTEAFRAAADDFLQLIRDLDQLLATRSEFLLGRCLEDAKRWGTTDAERARFEWNARRVLTLWGASKAIRDYARKEWSGMLDGFYLKRWEWFLREEAEAMAKKRPMNAEAFDHQLLEWERDWADQQETYPTEPRGDSVVVATTLWAKYADAFKPDAMSLTTGKPVICSSSLPPNPARLANDGYAGNRDRYWAMDTAEGDPAWWQVDFEEPAIVRRVVDVGYYGDQRHYGFTVETSLDAKKWDMVCRPARQQGAFHRPGIHVPLRPAPDPLYPHKE